MKMHITAGWRDAVFKKPIASGSYRVKMCGITEENIIRFLKGV